MCARNNNRPAGVKSASKIGGVPVIWIIQWFALSMWACKWCACNFCFAGKRDSNIRAPEKFLNVVDIFILQKTGHW